MMAPAGTNLAGSRRNTSARFGITGVANSVNAKLERTVPILGRLIPRMGMRKSSAKSPVRQSLADALFSTTQQRVLAILFGEPERSFYATEVIQRAGSGSGAVQRELAKLEQSGLVTTRRTGNQKHYQANHDSPIFAELRSIVEKTVALADPIRVALRPLSHHIVAAFVYGSFAKRRDTARSDIDLMVVSDTLAYAELYEALEPLARTLRRRINPTVYSRNDLARRIGEGNAFVRRVLEQPKIFLIGTEHDVAA